MQQEHWHLLVPGRFLKEWRLPGTAPTGCRKRGETSHPTSPSCTRLLQLNSPASLPPAVRLIPAPLLSPHLSPSCPQQLPGLPGIWGLSLCGSEPAPRGFLSWAGFDWGKGLIRSGQGETVEVIGYSVHLSRVMMFPGNSSEHLHPLTFVPSFSSFSLRGLSSLCGYDRFFQRGRVKSDCPLN